MNLPIVIYLSWIPYGIEELQGFIQSYRKHKAGSAHKLVLLFNGISSKEDYELFLAYAKQELETEPDFLVFEKGQDIEAYFFAAEKLEGEILLFFNTYSRLLADDWLLKYLSAFEDASTGVVSATASALSYYSAVFQNNKWLWEKEKSFTNQFRKYKLFLKAMFYWRFLFPSFPNYHFRTNAFMIRKNLMLQIHCSPLTSKFKAYLFESGHHSFTNQVFKKGYKVLVIDKEGALHTLQQTATVPVFWKGNQQLLLVADNQTRKYDAATEQERLFMSYLAWGEKSPGLKRVEL